jgi:hypothetical protein
MDTWKASWESGSGAYFNVWARAFAMKPNVESRTFIFNPSKLDDNSLDDLEDDLAEFNEEGWYIAATFPTGLLILERESVRIDAYTGAGQRRNRPERKSKEERKNAITN